jgi:SAM-dependent methyltransferase
VSTMDPYGTTNKLDETVLQAIVTRLEARGNHPFFARMLHEYLDAMQIETAHTVLDMGCGTGVVARTIARRPGFAGQVTGIDLSPYLTDVATRLATEDGVSARVTFRIGDTRRLDFPDATFDAVVAHTLMNHVDDPVAVVKEAARVLKPGGRVGIFDSDFSTIAFNHPDPTQGKAYDDALINALVTNPRIMRQMPRVLRTAGLELVVAFPYVLADIGTADYWLASVESYRKLLPQGGTMTAAEADAWADALRQDSEAGVFFGACNFYSYVAKRS